MSAWVTGNMKCRCSLGVLRAALISVMPDWEKYLLVDPEGKINLHRYSGAQGETLKGKTFHLVIPGSGHPGVQIPSSRSSDNDWGWRLISGTIESGEWEFVRADYNKGQAQGISDKIEKTVTGHVALLRAKVRAAQHNWGVNVIQKTGKQIIIDTIIPTSDMPSGQELA